MNNFHIPILSYVFIGVTTLVLTFATIADTENEIITLPTETEESSNETGIIAIPEVNIPSMDEIIDKVKSLNPFNTNTEEKTNDSPEIPTAVPVDNEGENTSQDNKEPNAVGGKKKRGKKSKKHNKSKAPNKSKKHRK